MYIDRQINRNKIIKLYSYILSLKHAYDIFFHSGKNNIKINCGSIT